MIIAWEHLTPGERDRLVAEQVMGQNVHADFAQGSETTLDFALSVDGPDGTKRIEAIPRYTQSMDAAWSVLLKMIERLDLSAGKAKEFRRHEEDALAYLFNDDYGVDNYVVWGESIQHLRCLTLFVVRTWTPEHICLAALKATGLEIDA